MTKIIDKSSFYGSLLGLACGDALGAPVEFKAKDSFIPVTNMMSGGSFNLKAGQWTDDTSMALCLADSLIQKKGFDALDQMQRYCRWLDTGYLSSTDRCFDVGVTIFGALCHFKKTQEPNSGLDAPNKAGNGSLMRLAPIPLFYAYDQNKVIEYAAKSSLTTHAAPECIEACQLYALMIYMALHGATKQQIVFEHGFEKNLTQPNMQFIASGAYIKKTRDDIDGSGYVALSLEAALWCFWHGNSVEECLLLAVNLGNDADTTGAICGQLAGAFYGVDAIPNAWYSKLAKLDLLEQMADDLYSNYRQHITA
jgi:ADP-ribosyl-[dinitrogen reductase] hydrolase